MVAPSAARPGEAGFSLVELLVVLLIIGILSAVMIPRFTGQREKGTDARAKADARHLRLEVEACQRERSRLDDCDSAAELPGMALTWGPAGGQVQVRDLRGSGRDAFAVEATSTTGTVFAYVLPVSGGAAERECRRTDGTTPRGGCRDGTW